MDPIRFTKNNIGLTAKKGVTGKYYCGALMNETCECLEIIRRLSLFSVPINTCGPVDYCNCVNCMQLDLESRRLPKGYLVNREGAVARIGPTGVFYCGRFCRSLNQFSVSFLNPEKQTDCDGYCGPVKGPNCDACKELDSLKSTRYASLMN